MQYGKIIDNIVKVQDLDDIEYNKIIFFTDNNYCGFIIEVRNCLLSFEVEHLYQYEEKLNKKIEKYIDKNKLNVYEEVQVELSIVSIDNKVGIKFEYNFIILPEIREFIINNLY